MAFTVIEPEDKGEGKGFTVLQPEEKKPSYTVLEPEGGVQNMNSTGAIDFHAGEEVPPNGSMEVGQRNFMLGQREVPQTMSLAHLLFTPVVDLFKRQTPRDVYDTSRNFVQGMIPGIPDPMSTGTIQADPTVGLPTPTDEELKQRIALQILTGTENATSGLLNSFLSPVGAATLGMGALPTAAQRLISGGFAAQMAHGVPERYRELKKAVQAGDPQGITEHGLGLGGDLAFTGMAARHATAEPKLPAQPNDPNARTQHTVQGDTIGSLNEVLSRIAQNQNSPYAPIAKMVLDSGRGTKLMNQDMLVNPNLQKAGGYNQKTGQAEVHPEHTSNDFVVLHEIMHAMTENRTKDPRFNAELEQIFNDAKAQLGEQGLHGTKSVDEFIAEGVTNPAFQQSLRFARSGNRPLLDRLIDLGYSALGRAREKGSLLEQAKPVMDRMLNIKDTPLRLKEGHREPGFVVDPSGQAVDMSQLTPKEQTELMRGPREYQGVRLGVRPAQEPGHVIGETITPKNIFLGGGSDKPVEPGLSATQDVQGMTYAERQQLYHNMYGSQGFHNPKIADPRFPEEAMTENRMPVEFPQKKSKIKLDDTQQEKPRIVTGPDAVNYRPPQPAPTQVEYQKRQAKQSIGEGLTQQSGQYVGDEALPYAKEGQYPAEGGPTGTLSKLQRERLLKGKQVRTGQQNNAPLDSGVEIPEHLKEERVIRAAVRGKNGHIYVGGMHPDAAIRAEEKGHKLGDLGDGFVTSKGRFISRDEAYKLQKFRSTDEMVEQNYEPEPLSSHEESGKEPWSLAQVDEEYKPQSKSDYDRYKELEGQVGEHIAQAKSDPTKMMEIFGKTDTLRQEMETIKNRQPRKGFPPEKPMLDSGVELAPQDNDKLAMQASRLLRNPDQLKFRSQTGDVDGGQLVNRLMNSITSGSEKGYLEQAGIREKFPQGKRTTLKEMDDWVQENEPKVVINKSMSEGDDVKTSRVKVIVHELDTLGYTLEHDDYFGTSIHNKHGEQVDPEKLPDNAKKLFDEVEQLGEQADEEGKIGTPHWSSVAPKPEDQMSGYVEIAVTKSIPKPPRYKELLAKIQNKEGLSVPEESDEWHDLHKNKFESSHNFPPNTLAWVRGHMETAKDGTKTFLIHEVQSDWAQQHKKDVDKLNRHIEAGRIQDTPAGRAGYDVTKGDPLLRHYETLALKSAIDHARKEGATRIALSDGETAMLTEGHDRAGSYVVEPGEYKISNLTIGLEGQGHLTGKVRVLPENNFEVESQSGKWKRGDEINYQDSQSMWDRIRDQVKGTWTISQEKGMRLHYDRTLPEILEKLTGNKGERSEFGEHKMAVESSPTTWTQAGGRNDMTGVPRKDLILKNSDGTPKTSITAHTFAIDKISKERETKPFTYFGKDQPGKMYSGVPLLEPGLAKQVKDHFKAAMHGTLNNERTAQLLDAADTKAKLNGRQVGNRINVALKDNAVDDRALTFITQAGGSKAKLNDFLTQVGGKNPQAKEAIQRAIKDYSRLEPYSKQVTQYQDHQLLQENARGIETEHLNDYMKHAYEDRNTGLFGTATGVSTSFTKPKMYPDYAAAIADGQKPLELRASKLLESRIAAGQKLMNRFEWADQLRNLKSFGGEPLVVDLVKRGKGKPKTAPEGYAMMDLAPGVRVAVHSEAMGIMKALTTPSPLRDNKWTRGAMQLESKIKHTMLMFDSYHLFRIGRRQAFLTGEVGYKKGLTALDYDKPTLDRMVKDGTIAPELAEWANKNRGTVDTLVNNGLNAGRVAEALFANKDFKQWRIDKRFNRWVFEDVSRGAMTMAAVKEFNRLGEAEPTWTDEQKASHISKQINIAFGNLQRQGVLKSETMRDIAQLVFLAPQWADSLVQMEARGYKQLAQVPVDLMKGKVKLGTSGKLLVSGVMAWVVANQVLNMAFQGKPTWENEKDHKFDAKLPGGYWMSPFADTTEFTHDAIKYTKKGKDPLQIGAQIVGNKLSPIGRAVQTAYTGRDYSGTKLDAQGRIKESLKSLIPTPLPVAGVMSEVPNQKGRQAYSTLGLKVESDNRQHEEALEKVSGKKFDKLDLGDRIVAEIQVAKARPPLDEKAKVRGAERSIEAMGERGLKLKAALSRADRGWLESRGLTLPGYDAKVTFSKDDTGLDHPVNVYLTQKEMERYHDIMLESYNAAIKVARPDYDKFDDEDKKGFFTEVLKQVRASARDRMKSELSSSFSELHKGKK